MKPARTKGTCPDCGIPTPRGGRCVDHAVARSREKARKLWDRRGVKPKPARLCSDCGEPTVNQSVRCYICGPISQHLRRPNGETATWMGSEIALRIAIASLHFDTQLGDIDPAIGPVTLDDLKVILGPMTMEEAGAAMGVSRERVRQLEKSGLRKLRAKPEALRMLECAGEDRGTLWDELELEGM